MSPKPFKKGQTERRAKAKETSPKALLIPLETHIIVIKHLHRTHAFRTLATLLRVSHQLYDLASPTLYKKITLDNSFLIHFFGLVPANGVWVLPRRVVDHEKYIDADHPIRRLLQSEISLTSKGASVDDRQKALLGLVETVEIPERIDSKLCTRLQSLIKKTTTPFANVRKAIFGPVILYEVGLYTRLPIHKSESLDHPTMIALSRLIHPKTVCAHFATPPFDAVSPLLKPVLCSIVSGISWSEMCESMEEMKELRDVITEQLDHLSGYFDEQFSGLACLSGSGLLYYFGLLDRLIVHGIDYEACRSWEGHGIAKKTVLLFRDMEQDDGQHGGSTLGQNRVRAVNGKGVESAKATMKSLLGEEEVEAGFAPSLVLVGFQRLVLDDLAAEADTETWEENKAKDIKELRKYTEEEGEKLGYKVENIRFEDHLGGDGCICCGLQGEDGVHEMVRRVKWRDW